MKIKEYWYKYGFEIMVVGSIVIIVLLSLFRIGKKGTWSTSYSYYQPSYLKKHPVIKDSKPELRCRQILEDIYKIPFSKSRPDFLRNYIIGGIKNLELDCYNPSMRLALEYNGAQHYKYTPYFHKNKEAFYNQCYRDDMKRRLCKDNGITLIEVPYTVKYNDLEDYIFSELRKRNLL